MQSIAKENFMLLTVVKAQLALVAVRTRDTMNLPYVVKHITKKDPVPFEAGKTMPQKGQLYWMRAPEKAVDWTGVYREMTKHGATLLVVNPKDVVEPMFDAGEIPVPKELMVKFMIEITDNEAKAVDLLRGLGGCTLKEAAEFARITMTRDHSLTAKGLTLTRKTTFAGSKGLTQVDTDQGFYAAPDELRKWMKQEKPFFLEGTDHRLIPRGLLMDGPPGVGKTAASKWIANELQVPLYRIDIGGTKNKWMGQSEGNMLANLQRLDYEAPCVALLDEIEKVFATGSNDHDGVTTTMLSQLLWWLAERRSRVLVIMTTNAAGKLPKELYREGRVDKVMRFEGLNQEEAPDFVDRVLNTFKGLPYDQTVVDAIAAAVFAKHPSADVNNWRVSQAALTEAVYGYVKGAVKPK